MTHPNGARSFQFHPLERKRGSRTFRSLQRLAFLGQRCQSPVPVASCQHCGNKEQNVNGVPVISLRNISNLVQSLTYIRSDLLYRERPIASTFENTALILMAPLPWRKATFFKWRGSIGGRLISGTPFAILGFRSLRINFRHLFRALLLTWLHFRIGPSNSHFSSSSASSPFADVKEDPWLKFPLPVVPDEIEWTISVIIIRRIVSYQKKPI